MFYLIINYEEIEMEDIAFGGNPKEGNINKKKVQKASDNAGQLEKKRKTKPSKIHLATMIDSDPPYSQAYKDTNNVNAAGTNEVNDVGGKTSTELPFDTNMPTLEDYIIFDFSRNDEDDDAVADMNNLDTIIQVNPIPTTRIHKDHPLDLVIRDLQSATQTRKMIKNLKEHGMQAEEAMHGRASTIQVYNKLGLYIQVEKPVWTYIKLLELDDIIFGSTKKELCFAFEKLMHEKFQMSYMRELTFFLGLQKSRRNTQETHKALLKDDDGEEVDVHMYRLMIGSLMYLTFSRPDIMFVVYVCARYQVNPKVSHLHDVKRIFSPKTTAWNEFSSTMASAIICLATNQKFNFSKFIFEGMIRNMDNVSSKFLMYLSFPKLRSRAGQWNITKTPSKATPNESSSLGTTLSCGPRCQETMGDTIAQTRFENVSKHSNDSLLARGVTRLRSDEDIT
ncbi:hypothetical protein Tco_0924614 [Tanacetum coccineum]|uniref:Reverse transcriptase Ty1/copia-type domain-containing protein n=1 Tax=Tanacetum coccineum TaxID=301880 RepID=A0ABQ5D5S9_9ASTR